jgi:molecular chaperone GrpE
MNDDKAPDDTARDAAEETTEPRAVSAAPRVPPPEDPLEAAQAEAAKMKDQLLRVAADFDNYKKRSRRELDDATKRARDDALRDLLPVFDNLERATAHATTTTDAKALADGIGMVMRQFVDTLSKMGIQRIAAVGEAFDPAVHEAVQHLETTEHPPGAVAMELQAGYRTAERVLRPAMVVVAKAPAS